MKNLLVMALIAIVSCTQIQAQTVDISYPAKVTQKASLIGGHLFSDGKYLLYGDFKTHNGVLKPGIARFNADGSVDNTFNIGTGPNANVEAVAVQSDGKILVGGRFTVFNGVARKILVRLNSDGSLDNTFNPNIVINNTGMKVSLVVQPDGKILFNGPVQQVDNVSTGSTLFRYNANGSRDASFTGPSYAYQTYDMKLQSDGKIVLVGSFTKGIVRLTSAGATDATFNVGTGFTGLVYSVEITSANQVIAGGSMTAYNGTPIQNLVALTSTAAIDATWQGNGKPNGTVEDMFTLSDGKILACGNFSNYSTTAAKSLMRLTATGALDATLNTGTGPNQRVEFVTANATGDILITAEASGFTTFNGTARENVAVLQSTGTLKSMTVHPNFQMETTIRAIVPQGTTKYLIGHDGTEVSGTPSAKFSRLNIDGTLDAAFGGNSKPDGYVTTITVDHNGKILIGGAFTTYNSVNTPRFARLSPEGVLETTFNTNLGTGFGSGVPYIIVEQPDGKILVGGSFSQFNGSAKRSIVRLNEDGTVDATFNTANGFSTSTGTTEIHEITLQSDGKILVGGEFNSFNNNAVKSIVRLNANGSYDNTLQTGAGFSRSTSGYVENIEVLNNGKILVGGNFNSYGASTFNAQYLAILSSTGTLENGFGSYDFFIVEGMQKQTDGKILVFDRNTGVQRLNADGSYDATFAKVTMENWPEGVVFTGTSLIVGGWLAMTNELVTVGIAKIDLPAAAPTAPTTLAATTIAETTIDLSWAHTGTTESGFYLERSVANNASYSVLATLPANTTSYSNTGLTANTQYFYRVRAFNATGLTAYTNEISPTTLNTIPTAPTAFALTVVNASRIDLAWTDNSSNESGFQIYRSNGNNTNYTLLTTTSANATSYSDVTVSNGTLYYYRIRSVNNGGSSGYDTERFGTATNPVPVAPSNMKFNASNSTSAIISWTDNATDEVDYVIERSVNNNTNYSQLAVLGANTTQYVDGNQTLGTNYFYRLTARNTFGSSAALEQSFIAGNYALGNKTVTACGGNLVDSGINGTYGNNENYTLKLVPATPGSAVQLQFSAFSTEAADQLKIYNGAAITDPLMGTYSGTTSPGTIRATNPDGVLTLVFQSNATVTGSGWSATVSCGIFPVAPGNVQLTVPNASEVKVSWTDNSTNELGFLIERSTTSPTSGFATLVSVPGNATSYSDNSASANTTYYYRVKAKGSDASSDSEFTPVQGLAYGDGGIWRIRKDFDGIARTDAVAFSSGTKGYVGLGWAGGAQTANFRSYDPATDTWSTTVSGFGGSVRSEAAGFVIGTKAYVGTGEWLDPENDLWEYDPSTNAWTQKADFGGTARTGAIGFSIGTKGYFGFGQDANGYTKDFWQYDPTANTWTSVAPFPGDARNGAVVFVIGDFAYAGTGYNGTTRLKDFYKYDPVANTWTAIATFPGLARRNAVAFAIDGKGYVGTGDAGSDRKDFYSYDPTSNTWTQIVNFGGSARYVAVAFAMGGKGYVTTGFDGSNRKDLWEFQPAAIAAAPAAPSNLTATATSSSQINISWTDNTINETGFVIERSQGGTIDFQLVATTAANTTSYSDQSLTTGTMYYYRVRATTPAGGSPFTANVSATTFPPAPAAPTGLSATLSTALTVQLAWTDNATDETNFVMERSVGNNTNYSVLGTYFPNVKTGLDQNITYATTYYYRVKAINGASSSAYSNEVSVTTGASPIVPPSNLVATVASTTSIRLQWSDNSLDESSFRIQRSLTANGIFTLLTITNANVTEYVDTGLSETTTYYYKVQASSSSGISSPTAVASATTLKSLPGAPGNLTATYNETADDIILTWIDNAVNEDDFVLEKSFDNFSFNRLGETTSTTYTDENPNTNFRVFYRVAARNSGGLSAFSNVAQVIITGIEDSGLISGVKTYPNPAVDKVMIEWTSSDRGEVTVSLCDLTGRILKEEKFDKNHEALKEEITLANVAGNAMVIMRMSIGPKSVTKKIVIK